MWSLPPKYSNKWIALHVSTNQQDLNFCNQSRVRRACKNIDNFYFNHRFGEIIGILRMKPVTSKQAIEIDPVFTNYPNETNYHFHITDFKPIVIPTKVKGQLRITQIQPNPNEPCLKQVIQSIKKLIDNSNS